MANTMYPTGVATTPIDFSGAANAFMQSALQTKLQEINQRKEQLTESGKAVAHFMSLEALPELAEDIREDFKGEIQGFRDKITNRFKETNGALTYDDKLMIEREYNRIGKNMEAKKVTAQKFAMAQQALWNKDANRLWTPETRTKVAEDFVKYSKGEDVDDPMLTLTSGVIIPPLAERLMSIAPEMMKRLDTVSDIEFKRDPVTGMINAISTTKDNEESVRETVRQSLVETRMPEILNSAGEVDEVKLNAAIDELVPPIQRISQKTQPIQPRVGRKSSGSGGIGKMSEIVPKTKNLPGMNKTVNGYMEFPDSQTVQHIAPTEMVNVATGKTEEVSSAKDGIKLVGLSFDEGKAYFQAEGGVMQKNGEPVFGVKGMMPVKATDRGAYTESEVRARAVEIANANIPPTIPSKDRKVGTPVVEKTENGYVVRFPVTYKKKPEGAGWLKSKSEYTEQVTVELNPVMGKEGATWYSTDLYTTGSNIMGATVKKYQTGGRSWEELLRAGRGGKTDIKPRSAQLLADPNKKFNVKGTTYTAQQIFDSFVEQGMSPEEAARKINEKQ